MLVTSLAGHDAALIGTDPVEMQEFLSCVGEDGWIEGSEWRLNSSLGVRGFGKDSEYVLSTPGLAVVKAGSRDEIASFLKALRTAPLTAETIDVPAISESYLRSMACDWYCIDTNV